MPCFQRSLFMSLLSCVFLLGSPSTARTQETFLRGDLNENGELEIGDCVAVLFHLFTPNFTARCEKAADFNDDGALNITDAIHGLTYLFLSGPPPAPPRDRCGLDPTPDALSCVASPCREYGRMFLINEVMAATSESLLDADGDSSDWIEIHLRDTAPANVLEIGGWYLTDDRNDLTRWRFPDGVTLVRGGYLIVFASGKDRAIAGAELHASFKLDSKGEDLALVAPDGITIVDELALVFPAHLSDVSYGPVRTTTPLVRSADTASYHVPTAADAALGTAWSERTFVPAGWMTGPTGLGFTAGATSGLLVTSMKANVTVDHTAVAESVVTDPRQRDWTVTETAPVIDYFATGESGNYPGDAPFPGIGAEETEDFVVFARGKVVIPDAATWTFGVNSDDGFRLQISGHGKSFQIERATPRGPGDTLGRFIVSTPGVYDLNLLYFQRTGGAELELFAARGSRLSFSPTSFSLVGDTANGGLGLQGLDGDVKTDLASAMRHVNASVWARLPFEVADASRFGELTLRMKYADGFVAYLNGQEIASRNAPAAAEWSSSATTVRAIGDAIIFEDIDVTVFLSSLVEGTNVLAIHGLNNTVSDGELLILPELEAIHITPELHYMTASTPGKENASGFIDFVRELDFSVEHGFFNAPFSLALTTSTAAAQIRYTLDGSTPTATTGSVYAGAIAINKTTVVRAAAFKARHLDAPVATRTYFFTSDIIRQSPSRQAPGPGWPTTSVNGQTLDYGMDPDIVDSATWGAQVEDALIAIPSISLVTDLPNLFSAATGIYVNAGNDGRAWERRTSVELIHPDGKPGFHLDAGLRIRGAFSRSDDNPKHSFRVVFRSEYGAPRLEYPLFGGEGVDTFERFDLRTSQNYSWAFDGSTGHKNTLLRDVFSRDVMKAMRQPYTRSRYYHLYLNGTYWGIYQTEERADADHAVSYLGGKDDDYDVIKNDSSASRALQATDGTMAAYRRLYDAAVASFASDTAYRKVLGLNPDGTPNPTGEALVNPQNLMDYMICTYYTGDPDAPVSVWGHISNNMFAIYNRARPGGFSWFRHDAEHSLGANGGLNEARLLTDTVDRSIGQTWTQFNPAWLHLRLTAHPEYLLEYADRVNRYFFHGGILSSGPNIERWRGRASQIELAIIAESARWGDAKVAQPRTKTTWQNESNWVTGTFFPQRTQLVINQMRSVNMFPRLGIVAFSQHGGEVLAGHELFLTQSNGNAGTIHYTMDGSDPRVWGGGLNPTAQIYTDGPGAQPLTILQTMTLRARLRDGSTWGAMTEARFTVGIRGLVINEILASNGSTLEDPDEPGEFPDWIELFNGAPGTIDLGGMSLTDDPLRLTKWRIAAGTTLAPGQHLVLYADDDGTQGPRHMSFQLSQSGETILLVDTDGKTVIDSIVFDGQSRDVAFGRYPDGTGGWGFHTSPSPGAVNTPQQP